MIDLSAFYHDDSGSSFRPTMRIRLDSQNQVCSLSVVTAVTAELLSCQIVVPLFTSYIHLHKQLNSLYCCARRLKKADLTQDLFMHCCLSRNEMPSPPCHALPHPAPDTSPPIPANESRSLKSLNPHPYLSSYST